MLKKLCLLSLCLFLSPAVRAQDVEASGSGLLVTNPDAPKEGEKNRSVEITHLMKNPADQDDDAPPEAPVKKKRSDKQNERYRAKDNH